MTNKELMETYKYLKEVNLSNEEFCKENDYFGKFGSAEYARLKNENEVLKMEIELMKRGLIVQ